MFVYSESPWGVLIIHSSRKPKCFSFYWIPHALKGSFLVRQGEGNMERCVQFNGKNNKIKI